MLKVRTYFSLQAKARCAVSFAFLLLLLFASPALSDVLIDEGSFPDASFRRYITGAGFDADGDGTLSNAEAEAVTSINCASMSIRDLTGIAYFPKLKELLCTSNQLTELDLTGNPSLVWLDCSWNQLTKLDVSLNRALESLYCRCNQLTDINVSGLKKLTRLTVTSNLLTELDVSQNPALTSLACGLNQLTNLDVRANTALTSLICFSNRLTELDVSQNLNLTKLGCYGNHLTELNLTCNTALLSEMAMFKPETEAGVVYFGEKYEDGSWWYAFSSDASLSVLPEGTVPSLIPRPSLILPETVTVIESEAFAGIRDTVFRLPASVTFIADDAFDASATLLVPEGSYAETRCRELGLHTVPSEE